MGRVLLIEPQKILQQAISLFLFPEHEVQVQEEPGPPGAAFEDYDLLIIDAAALRESERLTPESLRALQACRTPTLWLEEDESAPAPKRDRLVIVKKPLENDKLRAAVDGFFSSTSTRGRGALAASRGEGEGGPPAGSMSPVDSSEQPAFEFIDLVEVVDEASPPKQGRKTPRKSK